jgi:hypothetical protein
MERIVKLTQDFFKQKGFWQMNEAEQQEVCTAFWVALCHEYELQAELRFDSSNGIAYFRTGGGEIVNGVCTLYKPSIMTLLHEFRHILQQQIPDLTLANPNVELDAQLWSHGVFCNAMPILYTKNRQRNLFLHAPSAEELQAAWTIYTNPIPAETIPAPIIAPDPVSDTPIEQILQEAIRR